MALQHLPPIILYWKKNKNALVPGGWFSTLCDGWVFVIEKLSWKKNSRWILGYPVNYVLFTAPRVVLIFLTYPGRCARIEKNKAVRFVCAKFKRNVSRLLCVPCRQNLEQNSGSWTISTYDWAKKIFFCFVRNFFWNCNKIGY